MSTTGPAALPGVLAAAVGTKHHFSSEDWVLVAVVVLLIFGTGFLAMAETALTRTTKVKAITLVEEKRDNL